MKIAIFASEVVPYAKTGGLADVAGALPRYLSLLGCDVKIFLPLYREVRKKSLPLEKVIDGAGIEWDVSGGKEGASTTLGKASFSIWEHDAGPFKAYFIEKDDYYDRDYLYGTASGDYPDNGERFGFYAKASLEALKRLDFSPEIVHCHDWQSAVALAYLKFVHAEDPFFKGARSLFTIHNLAYQGLFERDILVKIGLPGSLFKMNDLEFYGKVNFLKAGILYATAVSTVSPRYSREIQTPEMGCGLDGLLRTRRDSLFGIMNGIDYAAWDPAVDKLIPANFGPADLDGKARCKTALIKELGLGANPETPLIGMVTRLAGQKGLDIVCEALPDFFKWGYALAVLGTGEEKIQNLLLKAQKEHPSQLGLKIAFDDRLARTIYAGSDLFLIPSKYEPCGLTQMYALKYGTIPVVRATGGLDDSIEEYNPAKNTGNGFKFGDCTAEAMMEAVNRAGRVYASKEKWTALIRDAMACDFSWKRAAEVYLKLFTKLAA